MAREGSLKGRFNAAAPPHMREFQRMTFRAKHQPLLARDLRRPARHLRAAPGALQFHRAVPMTRAIGPFAPCLHVAAREHEAPPRIAGGRQAARFDRSVDRLSRCFRDLAGLRDGEQVAFRFGAALWFGCHVSPLRAKIRTVLDIGLPETLIIYSDSQTAGAA